MDPGHAVCALFWRDRGSILENVQLLLTRSEFEFDGALPASVCEAKLHRRSRTHARKLVVNGRGRRSPVHFNNAVSDCHSRALRITVGLHRSDFGLAAKIRVGREPGRRSADRGFCHLKTHELEVLLPYNEYFQFPGVEVRIVVSAT